MELRLALKAKHYIDRMTLNSCLVLSQPSKFWGYRTVVPPLTPISQIRKLRHTAQEIVKPDLCSAHHAFPVPHYGLGVGVGYSRSQCSSQ